MHKCSKIQCFKSSHSKNMIFYYKVRYDYNLQSCSIIFLHTSYFINSSLCIKFNLQCLILEIWNSFSDWLNFQHCMSKNNSIMAYGWRKRNFCSFCKNIFCKELSHKLTFISFIPLWAIIWIYHLAHAGKSLIKKVKKSNIRLRLHNVILGIIKYSHHKKYSWFFVWRKYSHEIYVFANSNWN